MRCDINISVIRKKDNFHSSRVEIKNVQGTRQVQKAIEIELLRHVEEMEKGNEVVYETRRYDQINNTTVRLRGKDSKLDYMFMHEPDVPRIFIKKELIQ